MTFFWHFFDELFLNKGGRESGALKLPKMCVFGLKIRLFGGKRQKNHNFSVFTILDIGVRYSILDTVKSFETSGFDRYSIRYSHG